MKAFHDGSSRMSSILKKDADRSRRPTKRLDIAREEINGLPPASSGLPRLD
jgi:hypothetical protein